MISTVPVAFSDDVDPRLSKITVTFDQPMMDQSWSWTGGGQTYPKTTGKIHYDKERKTCTLPVKLQAGKVYWVGINSPSYRHFQTIAGIPAKRHVILFATKSKDGKPTPIPEDYLREAKRINGRRRPSPLAEKEVLKGKLVNWVEDFFSRNYRDITARKTLQWGQPETTPGGNLSIRYKFLATIRRKEKQIIEKRFTFTPEGKFVSAETIEQSPAEGSSTVNKADLLKAKTLAAKGWALWRQRKLSKAEELFRQAVQLNPGDPHAFNGLGWSQFNQGKLDEARQSLEKCVALEPRHSGAFNGLGWVCKGQGKTDEAIEFWKKSIEASPDATAALNGLTRTLMEQKKYDEAIRYYQMWLKAEPDNADAKKGLEEARDAVKE
ncbi:MAG: tetratricopeptide repeat protein [Phycisphaerae bacterium]|nr:tetratricopeptide repeat protein [Phycisphaerae bacterium]